MQNDQGVRISRYVVIRLTAYPLHQLQSLLGTRSGVLVRIFGIDVDDVNRSAR